MRRTHQSTGSEAGAISVFVVAIITALMMLAGLVIDGGHVINERQKLIDDAEQAARLGANQIDEATLRSTGEVVVISHAAQIEAEAYLMQLDGDPPYDPGRIEVSVVGNEVEVEISHTVEARLLSLINLGPFDIDGEARARPAVGIVEEIS